MRVPRVRFTVRRMMVVVAVVAAMIWAVMLWQRASFYRWKVRFHAQMETSSIIAVIEGPNSANRDELTRLSRVRSAHHGALRRQYEHAAARPREHVPSDPPDPVPLSGPGRRVDLHFEP
jgi:hypothetical protein